MSALLQAIGGLAAQAIVGRVLLACLPPGPTGGHALHQACATWATSHALGAAALVAEHRLLERCGARVPLWVELAPWVLLLALRLATLPGAMVPRHEPARARLGAVAVAFQLIAIAILVHALREYRSSLFEPDDHFVLAPSAQPSLARFANGLALVWILAHGLESARARPWMRATAALAAAALVATTGFADGNGAANMLALFFVAGLAFTIPWLRRGDSRARALAIAFLAACAAFEREGLAWGLGGTLVLAIATPAPVRARTALAGAAALAFGAWLGWARYSVHPIELFRAPMDASFVVLAITVGLASGLLLQLRSRAPLDEVDAASGFAPQREERVIGWMIAIAFALSLSARLALDLEPRTNPLFLAVTGMTLVLGLGLKHFAPRAAEPLR